MCVPAVNRSAMHRVTRGPVFCRPGDELRLTAVDGTREQHHGERLQASADRGASGRKLLARRLHRLPGREAQKVQLTYAYILLMCLFTISLYLHKYYYLFIYFLLPIELVGVSKPT